MAGADQILVVDEGRTCSGARTTSHNIGSTRFREPRREAVGWRLAG
ncbi:MAG: hypothetical protein ACLT98_11745 [Eggerthellaceae bacterium]